MTVTFRVCQACGHGQFVGVDVQSFRCQLCGNSNPINKEAFELMSDPDSASITVLIPGGSHRNDNSTPANRQAAKSDTQDKMEECEKRSFSKVGNSQIAEPWPPAETAETTTEPFECDLTSTISYFASEYWSKDYDVLRRNLLSYLLAIHTVFSADKFELLLLSGKKIERKKRMGIFKYDYATIKDSWNQTHTFLGKALSNEQFAKEVLCFVGIEKIGTIEKIYKKTIISREYYAEADKETSFQLFCTFAIDQNAPETAKFRNAYQYREEVANHPEVRKITTLYNRDKDYEYYYPLYYPKFLAADEIYNVLEDGAHIYYKIPDDRKPLTDLEMLSVLAVIEACTDYRSSHIGFSYVNSTPFCIALEKKPQIKPPKKPFTSTD